MYCERFLQQLCTMRGWERATWEDFIRSNDPHNTEVRHRRGKHYLAGMWGDVLEEAVKAEMRGVRDACGDVIDFLFRFGDEHRLCGPAEHTEEDTRRWIQEGKERRLPVFGRGSDSDSDSCEPPHRHSPRHHEIRSPHQDSPHRHSPRHHEIRSGWAGSGAWPAAGWGPGAKEDRSHSREPFLQQLCCGRRPGWEHATWEDYIRSNGPQHIDVRRRGRHEYLAGMWGDILEEAVRAEMRGVGGACGDVISFLCEFGDGRWLRDPAERTESKTRKWIKQGKEHRLPVWDPESDSD